jgi:hypothetical protein
VRTARPPTLAASRVSKRPIASSCTLRRGQASGRVPRSLRAFVSDRKIGSEEPQPCVPEASCRPFRSRRARQSWRSRSWRGTRPAPAIGTIEASPLRLARQAVSQKQKRSPAWCALSALSREGGVCTRDARAGSRAGLARDGMPDLFGRRGECEHAFRGDAHVASTVHELLPCCAIARQVDREQRLSETAGPRLGQVNWCGVAVDGDG